MFKNYTVNDLLKIIYNILEMKYRTLIILVSINLFLT